VSEDGRNQVNSSTVVQGTRAAFRTVRGLIGVYMALCVATLAAVVVLRNHHSIVTAPVWVRTSIVVASSLLMAAFAARAARGSRRAFLRLRLVSAIMVVAIVVIIAIPGSFPVWLKIEQGICGLVLIGVVSVVNGKHLRSAFAAG
jgi:hypothetical protein